VYPRGFELAANYRTKRYNKMQADIQPKAMARPGHAIQPGRIRPVFDMQPWRATRSLSRPCEGGAGVA